MINSALIENYISNINVFLWSTPIVCFIIASGLLLTYAFTGVQFKYFFSSWGLIFSKTNMSQSQKGNVISPLQAFINALSASLGNGGLAGMATVLVDGGPGTFFWVFILGFIGMVIRFAEVYAATTVTSSNNKLKGALAYISKLPFGMMWVYVYAFIMLMFIFSAGFAMQANSIGQAVERMTGFDVMHIGIGLAVIVLYIIMGGASRIMKAAEIIIPIKVFSFFVGLIALFIYHYTAIIPALNLVFANAFNLNSLATGATIFTMQQAITVGFARGMNATEAGLGTAAIFFGSSDVKDSKKAALMSMVSAFIATNMVCAMLILGIIVSGVDVQGLNGTKLVIAAFETISGRYAAPAITFLSISFGLGVLVAYAFLAAKMWEFVFSKSTIWLCNILLVLVTFLGSLSSVGLVWKSIDLLVGLLVIINVSGLLWNIPFLKKKYASN